MPPDFEMGLLQIEALERFGPCKGIGIVVEFHKRLAHLAQRRQRLPAQAGAANAQHRDGHKPLQRRRLFRRGPQIIAAGGNAQKLQPLAGMLLAQPVERGRDFGQRLVIAIARDRAFAGQSQIEIDGERRG